MALRVVIESTPKRAFASAIDWPGWTRAGRTPDEALDTLLAYAPRYASVALQAKLAFSPPATVRGLTILECLTGSAGTDFGVPGAAASVEDEPVPARDLARISSLVRAAWTTFDRVASAANDTTLTLGPRGGGRQVPKIVDHLREADAAYLHQLGWKVRDSAMPAVRDGFLEALRLRATGKPLPDPNRVRTPWSPRYAARRSAWHALDHAWEIEDRSPG